MAYKIRIECCYCGKYMGEKDGGTEPGMISHSYCPKCLNKWRTNMKFGINVTTEDHELLTVIEVDTDELNWDSNPTKHSIVEEIFDEFYKAIERED